MAATYLRTGRLDEAGRVLAVLLQNCHRTFGVNHVDTLTVAGNLAVCRFLMAPGTGSLQQLAQQVRDRSRVLGATHPMTLDAAGATATALRACGRLDEALQLSLDVVAARIGRLGHLHPDTSVSRLGVALVHIDRDELHIAAGELSSIDDDTVHADPIGRSIGLTALGHLAWCYRWLGRPELARDVARRAAAEGAALFGAPHPLTAGFD